MDLNIQIPDNTASIFEYLQKGLFISSNSTSEEVRDMYNEIDENYESLYQYFSQINYTLERGNEYFFFSRIEPKATLEQKIMRAYYWIDVLDFFKTYDETFGPGFRFQARTDIGGNQHQHAAPKQTGRYAETLLGQGHPQGSAGKHDTPAHQRLVPGTGK